MHCLQKLLKQAVVPFSFLFLFFSLSFVTSTPYLAIFVSANRDASQGIRANARLTRAPISYDARLSLNGGALERQCIASLASRAARLRGNALPASSQGRRA